MNLKPEMSFEVIARKRLNTLEKTVKDLEKEIKWLNNAIKNVLSIVAKEDCKSA